MEEFQGDVKSFAKRRFEVSLDLNWLAFPKPCEKTQSDGT